MDIATIFGIIAGTVLIIMGISGLTMTSKYSGIFPVFLS